jgi:uncharacterized protein (DUF342 family)
MPMENYQVILQELVRRSNEETRRLRILEQRMDSLDDKLNSLIETNLDRTKKSNFKVAETEVSLKSISNEILNLKLGIDKINKQLVKFAQRRDLKEIERMLDLLSPLREEFVTKEDLEEMKKKEEEEKIV